MILEIPNFTSKQIAKQVSKWGDTPDQALADLANNFRHAEYLKFRSDFKALESANPDHWEAFVISEENAMDTYENGNRLDCDSAEYWIISRLTLDSICLDRGITLA